MNTHDKLSSDRQRIERYMVSAMSRADETFSVNDIAVAVHELRAIFKEEDSQNSNDRETWE